MANHHIIDHTGIVGTFELLQGAMNTFNLGFDIALATVLAATLIGGDPVTWTLSIGAPDQRVGPPVGGLLGLFGTCNCHLRFWILLTNIVQDNRKDLITFTTLSKWIVP